MSNDLIEQMSGTFYGGLKQGCLIFRGSGGQTLMISSEHGARFPDLPSPIEASRLQAKISDLPKGLKAEYFEHGALFV